MRSSAPARPAAPPQSWPTRPEEPLKALPKPRDEWLYQEFKAWLVKELPGDARPARHRDVAAELRVEVGGTSFVLTAAVCASASVG